MTRPAPRLARRPLLGSAAVAALAGCGPAAEPRPPEASASTPGAGDLKDLIIATPILSPQPMTPDGNRLAVNAPNANIYERLTHVDEHFQLKPGLAERWELRPDGRTWRFFLRKGVTFHDGSPFTAADVIFSVDRAAGALVILGIGIPLGVVAALYHNRWPDVLARLFALIGRRPAVLLARAPADLALRRPAALAAQRRAGRLAQPRPARAGARHRRRGLLHPPAPRLHARRPLAGVHRGRPRPWRRADGGRRAPRPAERAHPGGDQVRAHLRRVAQRRRVRRDHLLLAGHRQVRRRLDQRQGLPLCAGLRPLRRR